MRQEVDAVDASLGRSLRYGLEIVWRRRFFILVPLLVSIPLSIIGSAMLPKSYTARTLLFFQQSSADPLRKNRNETPIPSLFNEIEALLKSGHILDPALMQIMGEEYPKAVKRQALARENLAASLSIRQLGRSFYEFRLKASDPQGLGEKLEVITSRFLESLLIGDQAPASSVQLVLNRRKFEMEQAQKAFEEFERNVSGQKAGQNMLTKARQLKETVARLEAKKVELKTVEFAIDKALSENGDGLAVRKARGGGIATDPIGNRAPTRGTEKLSKALDALRSAAIVTEPPEAEAVKKTLADWPKIAALKAKRDWLQAEIDRIAADVQGIEASLAKPEQTIELGKRLKRQLQKRTSTYRRYAERYADSRRTVLPAPIELAGSPVNIKVIDPPEDPKFANVSRRMYLIAGILAGLVLGCSAAIVAETLDQRLRRPEEFAAILGAPVICRLPNSQGMEDPLSLEIESAQTMHNVTPIRRSDRRSKEGLDSNAKS